MCATIPLQLTSLTLARSSPNRFFAYFSRSIISSMRRTARWEFWECHAAEKGITGPLLRRPWLAFGCTTLLQALFNKALRKVCAICGSEGTGQWPVAGLSSCTSPRGAHEGLARCRLDDRDFLECFIKTEVKISQVTSVSAARRSGRRRPQPRRRRPRGCRAS
jgi:hypothetical protein